MLRAPSGKRAFAARMALRVGSTFITMPGPPPYGRSSTVRCTSVAKSRGVDACTTTSDLSMARPSTPYCTAAATNCGNGVTTSMRIARAASPVEAPVEHDAPGLQIHAHDAILDQRNPMLPLAAHHDHSPGRRGAEVIHSAERLAVLRQR